MAGLGSEARPSIAQIQLLPLLPYTIGLLQAVSIESGMDRLALDPACESDVIRGSAFAEFQT